MKKVYKYKENRKLTIGETYNFWIIKKLKLPDGVEYFVIMDPYNEKHLLPTKFYKHYDIKIQNLYPCKVDRVNCQGRLFFEPVHPFYKVDNTYSFCFKKFDFLLSKKGIMTEYFIMTGETGETAYLLFEPNLKLLKGLYEKYKIIKIRKAKIFIQRS